MGVLATEIGRQLGNVPRGPFVLTTTATDARFLRPLGIPTYGFSPFLILAPDTLHVGLPNERIAVTGLVQGVELYRRVVASIAAGGD